MRGSVKENFAIIFYILIFLHVNRVVREREREISV